MDAVRGEVESLPVFYVVEGKKSMKTIKTETLEKKIEILEHACASSAGAYYNVNLSQDIVPGIMHQVIGQREYNVNEMTGLPENARFSEVIAYWADKVLPEDKEAYRSFFNRERLLSCYRSGESHVCHSYWTENVLSGHMFAEHHIVMYEDAAGGDVLAVSYICDCTQQMETTKQLNTKQIFLDVLCRDYTTVHYVDLNNDTAESLKVSTKANAVKLLDLRLHKKFSYSRTIEDYCEHFVVEANQKEFIHVMQREVLLRELSQNDRFFYRYESLPNPSGHKYFEVQAVRVNEDDFDGHVIVAFRHIDDIITREQKYQWELEQAAYTDALTGIGNRAALRREFSACEQNDRAACVVADVNNLKLCNDRYGHKEGDRVTIDAAECLGTAFASIGTCYRIGGDEFCVCIPEGDESAIQAALAQVQQLVAQKNEQRVMAMSIACGYAIRRDRSESMEQLFNRSDEMMYDTKYRMKHEFPVYCEERIQNYLNVLKILTHSVDAYLFLWDINRDQNWFFGNIGHQFALCQNEKGINKMEEMEAIVYPADRQMLHEDLVRIAEGTQKVHNMNYRWVDREGEPVWISCRGMVIDDDRGNPFVMIGRVSDKTLRYLYHPLTKLFNKNKMLLDLEQEFLAINTGYFMMVGIDNLNNINLRHGRSYGDHVIRHCAEVFEKKVSLRHVWHVENNCFALYLDADTEEGVRAVYDELLVALSGLCTLSAGVVPNNRGMFGDATNLYACAEMTLERAKSSGVRTIMFFSKEDLEQRIKTLRFLEEMQQSVEHGCEGFYLCYQPQIKAGNYRLFGAEALLRYRSKTQGEVYPDEFIPLLEQSKLINQVGMWVLETALRQCRRWRETVKDFHISVNFSAIQLKQEHIAENVLDILARTGMPGSALTIELTESMQLQGIQNFSNIFQCWRNAGIELSIDDFGTGYASMSYLKELDVSEIKIDKMFVRGIEEATYNYRLISNMIEFAKSNSIRICCEGVEDVRELTVLEGLSPNLIQGYLFAKPCQTEKFERTFIDSTTGEYKKQEDFVRKIYQYKEKMHVICFNANDILRANSLGLWIIRINEADGYHEMHADETMERVLAVDRKYMPQECYDFWYDRIREDYRDYVQKNVGRMMEATTVIQLEYPWNHPEYGEVMVRCSGRRVEDSDGMVTLEGYHRILDNIEEH